MWLIVCHVECNGSRYHVNLGTLWVKNTVKLIISHKIVVHHKIARFIYNDSINRWIGIAIKIRRINVDVSKGEGHFVHVFIIAQVRPRFILFRRCLPYWQADVTMLWWGAVIGLPAAPTPGGPTLTRYFKKIMVNTLRCPVLDKPQQLLYHINRPNHTATVTKFPNHPKFPTWP